MSKTAFDTMHDAISALDLYSTAFASSARFQSHKDEIVSILVSRSRDEPGTMGSALLASMAEALANMK